MNLNYHVIKCDLSDFSSIRNFVKDYKSIVGKLDVLINNAGLMNTEPANKLPDYTKDGLELVMGVNH